MHVIICVHDSLRHDFVGVYNPDEQNTPHMDEFAKDGVVFANAFSQTTWSKASGAAMLTGYYPTALGVGTKTSKAPEPAFHILKAIRKQGIKTIALSANSFISPKFGFGAGFDDIPYLYDLEEFKARPRRSEGTPDPSDNKGQPYVLLDDLNRLFFDNLSGSQDDVLGLIWSMDTHLPYFDRYKMDQYYEGLDVITFDKVPLTDPEVIRGIYRKMILYADEKFGELIAELKNRGIYDDAMVIMTGDHGESFGEHGQLMHSGIPYDELTHIPLIIKFPQNKHGGTTNSELVELVDLMSTIAEQLGIDTKHENPIHGKSLLRTIEKKMIKCANGSILSAKQRMMSQITH